MHLPFRARTFTSIAIVAGFPCALLPSPALPAEALTWRAEGPFFGTVVDVAFDARTPGLAYATAANGGVFRSADGGSSWVHAGRPQSNSRIEWLEVDPGSPGTLWLGLDNPGKPALWRSRDRGATWNVVTDSYAGQLSTLHPVGYRIAFAPSRPADIWVPSTNLHYRSRDGGKSWSDFRVENQDAYAMAADPKNPDIVYAGGHGGEQAHLARSADGGASRQRSDRDSGRYLLHAVAVDPADARQMLAASSGGGVYRSADGGTSWAPSTSGLTAAWVERIYAAPGSAAIFAQTATGLFRRDADGTWAEKAEPFEDGGDEVELDGMLFDGKSPEMVWAFDGSSAWRSSDAGRSFRALEKKEPSMREMMKGNLASAQFRSLAQDPGNPGILYAGSWSNDDPGQAVWKSVDGGKSFKAAGQGLPGDDVTLLRAAAPGVVYSVVGKALFRTDDGGAKWVAVGGGLPGSGSDLRDVVLDPTEAARLFVATEKGLFLSHDSGASFRKAGSALAEEDVEAVAVAPDGKLFAGSWRGVFTSRDGGATWVAMSDGLPHRDVRALAVGGAPGSLRLWVGTAGGSVVSTSLP